VLHAAEASVAGGLIGSHYKGAMSQAIKNSRQTHRIHEDLALTASKRLLLSTGVI
jgi:hypothetical protein